MTKSAQETTELIAKTRCFNNTKNVATRHFQKRLSLKDSRKFVSQVLKINTVYYNMSEWVN